MKRKPMLFERFAKRRKGMGREVIGLIGTHHGVGVTHTGLMLAFYLGEELGRKTALLECNQHQDMELIQKTYHWSRMEESCFSYHMISCYKTVRPEFIPVILSQDYECIIMDFGIDFAANKDEFLRCSIKAVIGGRSDWDIFKLRRFIEETKPICGYDSWHYLIPQACNRTVIKLSEDFDCRVSAIPVSEEPVMPSDETYQFFDKMFNPR